MNSYILTVKDENGQDVAGTLVWLTPDGSVIDNSETSFASPFTFSAVAATLRVAISVPGYLAKTADLHSGPNTVTLSPYEPYSGATVMGCRGLFRNMQNGKCETNLKALLLMLIIVVAVAVFFTKFKAL